MSRIGKQPIPIPEKVKVALKEGRLFVEGPLGKLERSFDPQIMISVESGQVLLKPKGDLIPMKAIYGLTRNLVRNMVSGVSQGFEKRLEINGVGYRADVKGKSLSMTLGFSHPIEFPIPEGISMKVEKQTQLQISGISKELVGETAARIRRLRPPEPYKGKGIKYKDELIRRKVGKAAVSGGGK